MATQTDYTRCLRALEDCRWVQMLVIADAAEDADNLLLARGWRALAGQQCRPKEFSGGHYWSGGGGGWDRPPARHYLPAPAFDRLPAPADNPLARPADQMKAVPGAATNALEAAARAVGAWLAAAGGGQVGEGVEGVRRD
jgi:hypothetical protein